MESDSFYVTAPSSASLQKYSENKGGHYKFDFPETLHLSPDWEVGLSEITYQRDWNNTASDDLWFKLDTLEITNDETSHISRASKFVKRWKRAFDKCGEANFCFYVVKKDLPSVIGNKNNLSWLRGDRPLTITQFVNYFNNDLKKEYIANGWTDMDSLPFVVYPKNEEERKEFKENNWPNMILRIKKLPKGVTLEEYKTERLLVHGKQGKTKNRIFTMADLIFSECMYYLIYSLGFFNEFWIKKNPQPANNLEEAKKKWAYLESNLLMVYLPITVYSVNDMKECEQNTKSFFPYWESFIETPQRYDLAQTAQQKYKLGRKVNVYDSSIKSEEDLVKRLWELLKKECVTFSTRDSSGIWIDKTKFKTRFSFTATNLFGFRLELSLTLCRVLGLNVNQLYQNTYVVPTTFYVSHKLKDYTQAEIIITKREELSQFYLKCEMTSLFNADLTNGINTLWIYSDVCVPTIVGDTKTYLLRTIPVPQNSEKGETCTYTYNKPFYFPLIRHTMLDMTIQIFDTYGKEPINFANNVICQLHFRKHLQPSDKEGLKRKEPIKADMIRV